MNQPADNERLLTEVAAEAMPAEFREALLGETLRRVRQQRRLGQMRRAAILVASLGLLVALVWLDSPRRPVPRRHPTTTCAIVRTQPLPASAFVSTHPFSSALIVASANVHLVRTTATSGGFQAIDDNQLLALVAPRPAVLVGTGPHSEELVFVNPEDRKGFPVD